MPSAPQYDERKALQLLADGSEYAFTQIFDQYRDRIYSVALKFLKSPVAAEEIVQDVFLKVWLKRSDLVNVQRLDNFLFIIARNFVYDRIKKRSYEEEGQKKFLEHLRNASTTATTDHLAMDHQYQQILYEAINQLPEQQRKVYLYSRQDGMSREEIAEKMQLSPLTVKTHLSRALQFIRNYLAKQFPQLLFTGLLLHVLCFKK